MQRRPMVGPSLGTGWHRIHGSALSQDHVVVAMPDVQLPGKQAVHDGCDAIEHGCQYRLVRAYFRKARALILPAIDHLETSRRREGFEICGGDQRVEEGRERRMARFPREPVATNVPVEPDVEP